MQQQAWGPNVGASTFVEDGPTAVPTQFSTKCSASNMFHDVSTSETGIHQGIYIYILVCGFQHFLLSIIYGINPSHWRTPSFFKMVIAPPTSIYIYIYHHFPMILPLDHPGLVSWTKGVFQAQVMSRTMDVLKNFMEAAKTWLFVAVVTQATVSMATVCHMEISYGSHIIHRIGWEKNNRKSRWSSL